MKKSGLAVLEEKTVYFSKIKKIINRKNKKN
jgi:hypothetical protein